MAFEKMFLFKELGFLSKQGFPVRRTVQLIKGVREKQRLAGPHVQVQRRELGAPALG